MAASSKGAVLGAVIGNGALTLIKFAAFLASGSGAMLSEAVHSLADTSNQALLFIGIKRSERPADARFQYGYGAERYFFALLSAVGIFVLGCGVSVYHGVRNLIEPHHLELKPLVFIVLAISLVVEGAIFVIAFRSVWAQKGSLPFLTYLKQASDPTAIAVLIEDLVACLGVLIAAAGILLSYFTHDPVWDSVASILIGLMLGAVALLIGFMNRRLILGPSIPKRVLDDAIEVMESQPSVLRVERFRTRILGAGQFRLSVEVEFDPAWLGAQSVEQARNTLPDDPADAGAWTTYTSDLAGSMLDSIAAEIDRIETELLDRHPELVHVDVEAD